MSKRQDQNGLPYMQFFYCILVNQIERGPRIVLRRIAESVVLASAMPYVYELLPPLLGDDGKHAVFYTDISVASFSFDGCFVGLAHEFGCPIILIACKG